MKFSRHARIRMSQRGIPDWMVHFVRAHGEVEGDEVRLDRRGAMALLEHADEMRRQALKVLDKGGVAVIEQGDHVVTTYNITERRKNG